MQVPDWGKVARRWRIRGENDNAAVKHGGAAVETAPEDYCLGASDFFFCSAASFWRRSASVDLITSI